MLIDFGVSKQLTVNYLTQIGTITGTLGYAPLEQMRGTVYPASDLYSLGLTSLRLLTGCFLKSDGSNELYDSLDGVWAWQEKLKERGGTVSDRLRQILDKLLE